MKMLSLIFLSVLLNVATATNPPQAFWAAYRTEMKKGFENFAFLPHVDEITLEAKDFVEGGYAKKVATYYSPKGPTEVNPITDQGPGVFIFAGVGSTTTQAIAVEYDLRQANAERSHGVSHSVTSVEGKTLGQSFGAKEDSVAGKEAQQLLADLLYTQKTWAEKKSVERNTVPVIFGKSLSSGLKSGVSSNGQLIRLIDIDEDNHLQSDQAGKALELLVVAAKKDHELKKVFSEKHKKPLESFVTQFYLQPKVGFKHDAGAFPNFGVWFVRTLNHNKNANEAAQVLLPGVNGKGDGKWDPIKAVGDVGGGTTRTIVKWKDNGGVDFGKEDGLTANKLYEMAITAGEGNAPTFASVYKKGYGAALAAAYAGAGVDKKWKSILSIMETNKYITALRAASGNDNEKWAAIGVALAEVIHSEMEIAGVGLYADGWKSKLPIVVLQTGAMRRDYFNPAENDEAGKADALRKPESIMGKSAAHSAYYDEYYYYGDQDYDYDEYDEGYDDDEYSLYEEAAANVRRAREEFRIAQQLRNWKGRGNSRLLSRYYH